MTRISPIVWLGGAALALLALSSKAKASTDMAPREDTQPSADSMANREIIRKEALAQGLTPLIALAFARVESGFNARAEGDRQWHTNTERYKRVVPSDNPFYVKPELWHSYGLFQLLAPYFIEIGESPRVLLDPEINARRGVKRIVHLYKLHAGDLDTMRLAYVGAQNSSPERKAEILARFHKALETEKKLDMGDVA